MTNRKKISLIAFILIIIGALGCLFTFRGFFNTKRVSYTVQMENTDFTKMNIQIENTDVSIQKTDGPSGYIVIKGREKEDLKKKFSIKTVGQTLEIEEIDKHRFHFFPHFSDFGSNAPSISVFVPEKQYEKIELNKNNGDAKIDGLKVTSLLVEADNADIQVNHVESKYLEVVTNNGDIELKNTSSEKIKTEADNGDTDLNNVKGELSGSADNGDISVNVDEISQSMNLTTDNGDIEITTQKKPVNLQVNTETDNGDVEIFKKDRKHYKVGNGEPTLFLKTDNGDIDVH